ncbi:conserved exported hypothetical protein [Desulfamplus magnetovallimortis]|uniref:Uncharacterized protein n=1 Tax=Desulfamplus magnetovallimortis TaxID=1246637 RepID=A0A1W1HD90_9BACT|nr:hypothetical protein [Desulfamplus magnetovallimortis]SLM30393.1 conserved exported hypothetical protein [Desulfamplus magnetovallimortis]
MKNFKFLNFMILVFVNCLFPFITFAVETAPRISDREITEKLVRLEAGQEALRAEIKLSNDALRSEMKSSNDALRSEMKSSNDALRSEMKSSNDDLRSEMKSSNDALRSEMKSSNDALRSELKSINEALSSRISDLRDEMKSSNEALSARISDLRDEMRSNNEALSARISDLRDEMKSSNEALNRRLDDSYNTMLVFFASLVTLIVALFAYIAWDRRTMVKPVVDQLNLLERKVHDDLDLDHSDGSLLRRQLQALRQFAEKNAEFAEIMRGLALL